MKDEELFIEKAISRVQLSRSFHRLQGKTQVFTANRHDHVRNRLTHTLFVQHIGCSIARHYNKSASRVSLISLCHDFGHSPFGHAGERTLNYISNNCFPDLCDIVQLNACGFKHNWQSVRICCDLENFLDLDLLGIPKHSLLFKQVMYGILAHTSFEYPDCPYRSENTCKRHFIDSNCFEELNLDYYEKYKLYADPAYRSDEADIVAVSDAIAQIVHDIIDAYYYNIVNMTEMSNFLSGAFPDIWRTFSQKQLLDTSFFEKPNAATYLGHSLLKVFLESIYNNVSVYHPLSERNCFSTQVKEGYDQLKMLVKNRIVHSQFVQRLDARADSVIPALCMAYLINPTQMHDTTLMSIMSEYIGDQKRYCHNNMTKTDISKARIELSECIHEGDHRFKQILLRGIVDHISGMTDNYALDEYRRLCVHQDTH